MNISRRTFLAASAAGIAALGTEAEKVAGADADPAELAEGPFEPNWESLRNYKCPEWFRDAKFGIWAHWTAQCVPEMGDWYARSMYEEGSEDYKDHLTRYGHPSKAGFKDIDHIWHAENWDPERLIGLYKKAGAKYFVALANHHDNFDCFSSKHQPWNSTKIGPMKDIVGGWEKAARAAGMHFGVTVHASRAWAWFEVAQGADKSGPMAGVPYDGKLTKADGKGQWWEGLDPQELYAQSHTPGKGLEWNWDASKGSSTPDKPYCEKFYSRVIDLIESYHPDLVYFDDNILPLYQVSDVGLRIAAHYYNSSIKHHGKLEAVLNGKGLDESQRLAMVHDFERGRSDKIEDAAWQTDTCIGEWHYRRSLYDNKGYKTTAQVVKMLVDIVSKNGNLLLNIPVRGDGTIDPEEEKFVEGMAAWMAVNSEAIYSTRPWKIAGEGPIKVKGGGFSEGGEDKMGAEDLRFTTRGNVLYATAYGWPANGKLAVRVLASNSAGIKGKVRSVSLLGSNAKLAWERTPNGLEVTLPQTPPCEHAYVLKITGIDLEASQPVAPPPPPPPPVHAVEPGIFWLTAQMAQLDGSAIHVEYRPLPIESYAPVTIRGGVFVKSAEKFANIGYWDNPADTASWLVHFDEPGSYSVTAYAAAANGASEISLEDGKGERLVIAVPATKTWDEFRAVPGHDLKIATAGEVLLTARAADRATWKPVNLAFIILHKL